MTAKTTLTLAVVLAAGAALAACAGGGTQTAGAPDPAPKAAAEKPAAVEKAEAAAPAPAAEEPAVEKAEATAPAPAATEPAKETAEAPAATETEAEPAAVEKPAAPASAAPVTTSMASPTPEAPEGAIWNNRAVGAGKFAESDGKGKWRTAVFFAEVPGFPLPMFSDPDRRDVTTAHLVGCAEGAVSKDGENSWKATFYYDETPNGDFADLDTICADPDGSRVLGTETTLEVGKGSARTVVESATEVEGADGRKAMYPAPVGAELHVVWKTDEKTGLTESWAFQLP